MWTMVIKGGGEEHRWGQKCDIVICTLPTIPIQIEGDQQQPQRVESAPSTSQPEQLPKTPRLKE